MNHTTTGNRIRNFREKKAWTQEHLAGAADISGRTVQRAEEGVMSAETLTALAGALNVKLEDLTKEPNANNNFGIISPILYYEKSATLQWLVKTFGFEIMELHKNPDGSIMHAELSVGEGTKIMCGSPMPGCKTPKKLKAVTQSLNIMVDNVDVHYKRAKKAKAEILMEPQDGYGYRRYQTRDPEGHIWYFSTAIEE